MNSYKVLNKQNFTNGNYSIVPIRSEDRLDIMKWRNEQIYHLRQNKPLTEEDQNRYFETVVSELFDQENPTQILFSYLEGDQCIGYGGLVHINWNDKNAEISFIMNTQLENECFEFHWIKYLELLEQVAFSELSLHKIYTYAFDLRHRLYSALESMRFCHEATLKEHCYFNGKFIDVIIHSKINSVPLLLRDASICDAKLFFDWANDPLVRKNAFNSELIVWEKHLNWFMDKLESTCTQLYILTDSCNSSIGQIRIDLIDGIWEIDYSIDPQYRGRGYGKKIIELLLHKISSNSILKGIVKNTNIASLKVFKDLGFESKIDPIQDITYFQKIVFH